MQFQGHSIIMGMTGSGKTYHTMNTIIPKERKYKTVFFWNGGHEQYKIPGAVYVDGNTPEERIRNAVNRRRVIIYTPHYSQKIADQEINFWQIFFMNDENKERILFVVDEAPRYSPQGSIDTPLHYLATGGRRWGVECVFICQRVADLTKTVATQCTNWVIFRHSPIDAKYLTNRGIVITPNEYNKLNNQKYYYLTKNI